MREIKNVISLRYREKKDNLANVGINEKVRILKLLCEGAYRRRLFDLGMIPGTEVKAVMISPLGNPIAYEIRGSIIALRLEDAAKIIIKKDNVKENGGSN